MQEYYYKHPQRISTAPLRLYQALSPRDLGRSPRDLRRGPDLSYLRGINDLCDLANSF